jgi:hypothetical protein
MNLKNYFLKQTLVALAMQPIVYLVLSPYMILIVGLNLDQMIVWWIAGIPMGIVLNFAVAIFLSKTLPKMNEWIDSKIPVVNNE